MNRYSIPSRRTAADVAAVPLAFAADYLDRFPAANRAEAARAAAWRVTDDDGGWCWVSLIMTDGNLADTLNAMLHDWLAEREECENCATQTMSDCPHCYARTLIGCPHGSPWRHRDVCIPTNGPDA